MDGIYLVTGAAGHLGSVVTEKLAAAGKRVRALMLPGETRPFSEKVEIFHGDVREPASMEDFFAAGGPERVTVIHCAGIVSIASCYDSRVYDVNVNGTRNVVELCRRHRVNRLIYVSSVHAIPEKPEGEIISEIWTFSPDRVDGLYAKTKAEATALVLEAGKSGLDVCVVHPSGIIGPYDAGTNHLTEMVASFCRGKLPAAVRGGYDFVDVRDVADGIIACAEKGRSGECYILSNRYCSLRELLGELHALSGKKAVRLYLPLWLGKCFAPLAEHTAKVRGKKPLFTAYSMRVLGSNALFSHEKATRELDYRPRSLQQTLADTVEWLGVPCRRKHGRMRCRVYVRRRKLAN